MAFESKNPEEALRAWREIKDAITSNCDPGEVFDADELVEYVMDSLEDKLRDAIDNMKKPGDLMLNLSCFEKLAEEWAKDNGYVKE